MADDTSTDTPSRSALELMVQHAARQYGLDPTIFRSLIERESAWKTDAVSPRGAIGLGQLMPETATALKIDPHDPAQNIDGAARYLRQQLDAFGGDYRMAAAAYNWGPGNVQKFGLSGAPPSVTSYVSDVMGGGSPGSNTSGQGGNTTVTLQPIVLPASPPPFYPMGQQGLNNGLMGRQQSPLDKLAMVNQLMHLFNPNNTAAAAGTNPTQNLLQALAQAGQRSRPNPLMGGIDI